jgi:hypothetical protein
MIHLLAAFGLMLTGLGAFWCVAKTPRNAPIAIDGTLIVLGVALWIAALVTLLKAAFA